MASLRFVPFLNLSIPVKSDEEFNGGKAPSHRVRSPIPVG
jgi:hypothetical protein